MIRFTCDTCKHVDTDFGAEPCSSCTDNSNYEYHEGGYKMKDELRTLYKTDADFRHYVDEWSRNHNLTKEQIFEFDILREYAKWLKENRK